MFECIAVIEAFHTSHIITNKAVKEKEESMNFGDLYQLIVSTKYICIL